MSSYVKEQMLIQLTKETQSKTKAENYLNEILNTKEAPRTTKHTVESYYQKMTAK